MKYKKYTYIIVLILMLVVGISSVDARRTPSRGNKGEEEIYSKECYYISKDEKGEELKVVTTVKWGKTVATSKSMLDMSEVTVHKYKGKATSNKVPLLNWKEGYLADSNKGLGFKNNCTDSNVCFEYFYTDETLLNETNPSCPMYVVVELNKDWTDEYYAWGTNSSLKAQEAVNSGSGYVLASNFKNGVQIDHNTYYNTFITSGITEPSKETLKCEEVFTTEIQTMISDALMYPKIIVPILIILLGTVDFAKAVIASKEDEMKKAQSKFIKRVIAGVAVFLIPVFIDIIMDLANIVWDGMGYTQCNFK